MLVSAPRAKAESSLRDCTAHIGQFTVETRPTGLRAYLTEKHAADVGDCGVTL